MPTKKAPKSPATPKIVETKEQRFVRLATKRTGAAIKKIVNIGNLGGPGYVSTQEQRDKIISSLTDAVTSVKTRLNKDIVVTTGFSL